MHPTCVAWHRYKLYIFLRLTPNSVSLGLLNKHGSYQLQSQSTPAPPPLNHAFRVRQVILLEHGVMHKINPQKGVSLPGSKFLRRNVQNQTTPVCFPRSVPLPLRHKDWCSWGLNALERWVCSHQAHNKLFFHCPVQKSIKLFPLSWSHL